MSLRLPYLIVDPSSSTSNGFILFGQSHFGETFADLVDLCDTVINCKPGIWLAALREKSDELNGPGTMYEVCFRWVGELNKETRLDFSADVNKWKAWGEKMSEMFSNQKETTAWDTGVDWTSNGGFYDDGGTLSVVSEIYLMEQTANAIIDAAGEDDEEDLDFSYYLETIALNEEEPAGDNIERNYVIGGISRKFLVPL
jgi:hypothetical protein